MFCALSGRSLSWNTPVFCRFTAREHAKLLFIIMCFDPYHSKARAPKVLWEKGIFRRSKELNSDLRSCPLVWAPCWKFEWRHHVSSSGPDWRKRKSKEEERRRGKKSNRCTLCFYNMVTLETVFGRKNAVGWKRSIRRYPFHKPAWRFCDEFCQSLKCAILKWQTTFYAIWNRCCSSRRLLWSVLYKTCMLNVWNKLVILFMLSFRAVI